MTTTSNRRPSRPDPTSTDDAELLRVERSRGPAPRACHGIRPASALGGRAATPAWPARNAARADQVRQLGVVGPEADRATGQEGRAERRRLGHGRPLDGPAEQVRLDLEQEVVGRGSAVGPQDVEMRRARRLERLDEIDDLVGDGLERRACEMGADVVPAVMPVMVPRASGSQYGAPRPANAGTKTTPPVSGTEAASASTSAAARDDAQAVAQPADGRAGHEDAALRMA